jgi:carbon storage regulator
MLVLSRKKDESIVIPELSIKIMVIKVRGDKVRLGIEAPKSTKVHREEVWDAICQGQVQSAAIQDLKAKGPSNG